MARSLVLQEARINGFTNPNYRSVMLISERVLELTQTTMTYNGTLINATCIEYMTGDGSKPDLIYVSQAASDIRASINTANTTNNIEVVALTIKNADGTTTAKTVNISDIVRGYAHPESTFDALVLMENATKDFLSAVKTDETVQSLVTSMNS